MPLGIPQAGSSLEMASWIWHNLVPGSGQADTVQGELLRAVEKLRWEAQTNGNLNWDEGFAWFVGYLGDTLLPQPWLTDEARSQLARDLQRLSDGTRPYIDDDLYDRIVDVVVAYARAHPEPVPRQIDPGLRR